MKENIVIEYYDRENDYHGIGTFHLLDTENIEPGDKFIVPNIGDFKRGCLEGRVNHPAYMKPILLTCKNSNDTHINVLGGGGSWAKWVSYVENK